MAADSAVVASTVVGEADANGPRIQSRTKGISMLRSVAKIMAQETKRLAAVTALAVIAIAVVCLPASGQQASATPTYAPTEQPKGKAFSKPANAAAALYAAAKRNDDAELVVILGPDCKEIIHWSDDAAERQERRAEFAQKYEQMHRLVREPDNTIALYVGAENWPLPVPLVEYHGAWYFDVELGKQEIRYRRIGRNEMAAIEVGRNLVDAEKEYRASTHQYTAKFVSSAGSRDGLYWKSAGNSAKSPIGPYLAQAGVTGSGMASAKPFHGYYYRVVLQGSDDLAVVAFPAQYRESGVMTFVVNRDGTAYEKDLGEQTAAQASQISSSRPDSSWKQVE